MSVTSGKRILVVGFDYEEGFARLIADEFVRMGHSCSIFDPRPLFGTFGSVSGALKRLTQRVDALLEGCEPRRMLHERRLLKHLEKHRDPDLVLSCWDFLLPPTVALLKKRTRAPIALWFPDAIASFGRHSFLNGGYDALFFKDPYVVSELCSKLDGPIYYLPECFSPHDLEPADLDEHDWRLYGCDIATAGNLYPYRIAFFAALQDFHVKIWGNAAPRWALAAEIQEMVQNRFVAGREKVKAFRAARIVLNNLHPAEIWGINARAFEIAGAGGFQLIDWRPGLHQLFKDGEEIISFRSKEDLLKKIQRWLPAENDRRAIAVAGRRRALAEHTYRHRLQLLLDTVLGGTALGFEKPEIRASHACDRDLITTS